MRPCISIRCFFLPFVRPLIHHLFISNIRGAIGSAKFIPRIIHCISTHRYLALSCSFQTLLSHSYFLSTHAFLISDSFIILINRVNSIWRSPLITRLSRAGYCEARFPIWVFTASSPPRLPSCRPSNSKYKFSRKSNVKSTQIHVFTGF